MAKMSKKHIVVEGEIVAFDKRYKEGQLCCLYNAAFRDKDGVTLLFERLIVPESMFLNFNFDANGKGKFYIFRMKSKKNMSGVFYAAETESGQMFYYKEDAEKILKLTARAAKHPMMLQLLQQPTVAVMTMGFMYVFWIVVMWVLVGMIDLHIFKKYGIGIFDASAFLAIFPTVYFVFRPFLFFRWQGETLYPDMMANLENGGFVVAGPANLDELPEKY